MTLVQKDISPIVLPEVKREMLLKFQTIKVGRITGKVLLILGSFLVLFGLCLSVLTGVIPAVYFVALLILGVLSLLFGAVLSLLFYRRECVSKGQLSLICFGEEIEKVIIGLEKSWVQAETDWKFCCDTWPEFRISLEEPFKIRLDELKISLQSLRRDFNGFIKRYKDMTVDAVEDMGKEAAGLQTSCFRIFGLLGLNAKTGEFLKSGYDLCKARGISDEDTQRILRPFKEIRDRVLDASRTFIQKKPDWTEEDETEQRFLMFALQNDLKSGKERVLGTMSHLDGYGERGLEDFKRILSENRDELVDATACLRTALFYQRLSGNSSTFRSFEEEILRSYEINKQEITDLKNRLDQSVEDLGNFVRRDELVAMFKDASFRFDKKISFFLERRELSLKLREEENRSTAIGAIIREFYHYRKLEDYQSIINHSLFVCNKHREELQKQEEDLDIFMSHISLFFQSFISLYHKATLSEILSLDAHADCIAANFRIKFPLRESEEDLRENLYEKIKCLFDHAAALEKTTNNQRYILGSLQKLHDKLVELSFSDFAISPSLEECRKVLDDFHCGLTTEMQQRRQSSQDIRKRFSNKYDAACKCNNRCQSFYELLDSSETLQTYLQRRISIEKSIEETRKLKKEAKRLKMNTKQLNKDIMKLKTVLEQVFIEASKNLSKLDYQWFKSSYDEILKAFYWLKTARNYLDLVSSMNEAVADQTQLISCLDSCRNWLGSFLQNKEILVIDRESMQNLKLRTEKLVKDSCPLISGILELGCLNLSQELGESVQGLQKELQAFQELETLFVWDVDAGNTSSEIDPVVIETVDAMLAILDREAATSNLASNFEDFGEINE